MVGYLQSQGINVALVGASSGLGAFFGLLGTWLFPLMLDNCCGQSLQRTGSTCTILFFVTILPGTFNHAIKIRLPNKYKVPKLVPLWLLSLQRLSPSIYRLTLSRGATS